MCIGLAQFCCIVVRVYETLAVKFRYEKNLDIKLNSLLLLCVHNDADDNVHNVRNIMMQNKHMPDTLACDDDDDWHVTKLTGLCD